MVVYGGVWWCALLFIVTQSKKRLLPGVVKLALSQVHGREQLHDSVSDKDEYDMGASNCAAAVVVYVVVYALEQCCSSSGGVCGGVCAGAV
jgi:hypothetical protein